MDKEIKIGCLQKFKIWFNNVNCKISCSNCVVNKTKNNIDIDIDGDGIIDYTIPIK